MHRIAGIAAFFLFVLSQWVLYWVAAMPNPPALAYGIVATRSRGILISETSMQPLVLRSGEVFAETSDSVDTHIAFENTNSEPVAVSFSFWTEGSSAGSGKFTIPANAVLAGRLTDPPFRSPRLEGTLIFEASLPLSVAARRLHVNQRGELLTASLPVFELPPRAAAAVTIAHVAHGPGWKTDILVLNPGSDEIEGMVEYHRPDSEAQSFAFQLPARAAKRFLLPRAVDVLHSGYIRIVPGKQSKGAEAFAILSRDMDGITVSQSIVPASLGGKEFRFVEETIGKVSHVPHSIRTGIAIANPESSSATISLRFESVPQAMHRFEIPPHGYLSAFIDQLPELSYAIVPRSDIMRLQATSNVNIVALHGHWNERSDFLACFLPAAGTTR
jgi:hypothetical protein